MKPSHKLFLTSLLASSVLVLPAHAFAQSAEQPPAGSANEATADPDADQVEEVPAEAEEEIVVRSRFIPNVKRTTSEVSNVLTAEELARGGDSDIAGALTRVTGLSLVGEGNVFVRGLGERYSNTLLDGSTLSSPDPLRRVVPLDIIPTELLSSVVVQKTFSAQFPAEFGGGLVSLSTRAVPNEAFFEVKASTGYNTASTFKRGLGFDAGGGSFFGLNGQELNLPTAIAQELAAGGGQPFSQAAARSLRPNYSIDRITNAPDLDLGFSAGLPFKIFGKEAGILVAFSYGEDFRNQFGVASTFTSNSGVSQAAVRSTPEACAELSPGIQAVIAPESCGLFRSNFNVNVSGLGAFGIELSPKHELKYTTTVLRDSTRQARIQRSADNPDDGAISDQRLFYVVRQLYTNQITGKHQFDLDGLIYGIGVDWRVAYSRAQRSTPYRREYRYAVADLDPTARENFQFLLAQPDEITSTSFSALADDNYEAGLDTNFDGKIFKRDFTIKAGVLYVNRSRVFNSLDLGYTVPSGNISQVLTAVPELIFSPDNLGPPGGFQLVNNTNASDAFGATFQNYAAYVSFDVHPIETIRWTAGLRYEYSRQSVSTFLSPDQPQGQTIICGDRVFTPNVGDAINCLQREPLLFPSSTLTWEFFNNMQLRLGYSETVNRPDLRELSNSTFLNEDTDFFEQGDPAIDVARLRSYDARWEWYFLPRQSVTFGVFYKNISNAIEERVSAVGDVRSRIFTNVGDATLFGLEAEAEIELPLADWFSGVGVFRDRRFFFSANGTYIDSELSPSDINQPSRRLQGQSNFLGNLQLGYDSEAKKERFALLVNYQGDRIFAVATPDSGGLPSIDSSPPILVDLTFAKGFGFVGGNWEFEFKAKNLLGDEYLLTQGALANGSRAVLETYEIGRSFTTGLKLRF